MSEPNQNRTARVIAAKESLVSVETDGEPIVKNEVGYVELESERLKAEVLRVRGNTADMLSKTRFGAPSRSRRIRSISSIASWAN